MTARRTLAALALLLASGAWAGGVLHDNPTTLRPRAPTTAVQSTHIRPAPIHTGRSAAPPPPAPRSAHPVLVLALRGVTVEGDTLDLPVPPGLLLTDPLPVPLDPLADLEIDTRDGQTLVVAIDDPDAAAEAGAVIFDGPAIEGVVIAAP